MLSLDFMENQTSDVSMKKTASVAKVVLHAARLLIRRMTLSQVELEEIQVIINCIKFNIVQPYDNDTIFPIGPLLPRAPVLSQKTESFSDRKSTSFLISLAHRL